MLQCQPHNIHSRRARTHTHTSSQHIERCANDKRQLSRALLQLLFIWLAYKRAVYRHLLYCDCYVNVWTTIGLGWWLCGAFGTDEVKWISLHPIMNTINIYVNVMAVCAAATMLHSYTIYSPHFYSRTFQQSNQHLVCLVCSTPLRLLPNTQFNPSHFNASNFYELRCNK